MKKNFLGLILLCCIGLFASCSDDDTASGGDAGQMRVSAILPQSLSIEPSVVAGHKLRCILELWTKGEGAKLAYHGETTMDPTAEMTRLPFDLTVDTGTYDCLMWVDYIDAASSPVSRAEDGISRYTDKYYDTSDLRAITVKDINRLINNDACDAFYYSGEVQKKNGEALVLEPELVRPFAKVSILEKNLREFNLLQGLSATYHAATGFNVGTGKVAGETVVVNFAAPEFNSQATPDGTLFTAYMLANEEAQTMDEVRLNFTTKLGIQQVTVPADLIPLLRNQHIKVSGNMMAESPVDNTEFEITYDINVDDWASGESTITTRPVNAKVGDFFYADGTYSSSYLKNNNNPCIGIVFAVAHDSGKASSDKPENYVSNDGTKKLKEVHGWVIALKDVVDGNTKIAPAKIGSADALDITAAPASLLGSGKEDILGFKNTEAFKSAGLTLSDYPIAEAMTNYEAAAVTKAPKNTSGWYWGAVKQYLTLSEEYAKVTIVSGVVTDVEMLSVGNSLQVLIDAGLADPFSLDGEQFYWSNTVEKAKESDKGKLYRVGLSTAGKNYGQTAAWKVNDARHARAILTF